MNALPPFLRDLIASPPNAGEGVHNWMFRVSRQLHAHLPVVEIVHLFEQRLSNCGRRVPLKEIQDAVSNSIKYAWRPARGASVGEAVSHRPERDAKKIQEICADGYGLADLWELSNPRIGNGDSHAEKIIDRLFPGNPLLCCGKTNSVFDTKRREEWRGQLSQLQFIVPSPMSATHGATKDGRKSKHTLDNTGPRRFLVIEFDDGTTDQHAAILLHLGKYKPLICAVHSGGKSLHGWFFVHGQDDAETEKFFRYAVSLGADRATWTRSQFVRMPDGSRVGGNQQVVYFLNFQLLEVWA